jgi:hypothetical protein
MSAATSTLEELSVLSLADLSARFAATRVDLGADRADKETALAQFKVFFQAFVVVVVKTGESADWKRAAFTRIAADFKKKFSGLDLLLSSSELNKLRLIIHPDKNPGIQESFAQDIFHWMQSGKASAGAGAGAVVSPEPVPAGKETAESPKTVCSLSAKCSLHLAKIKETKTLDGKFKFFDSNLRDKAKRGKALFKNIKSVTDFMAIWAELLEMEKAAPRTESERFSRVKDYFLTEFLTQSYTSFRKTGLITFTSEPRNLAFKIKNAEELLQLAQLCSQMALLPRLFEQPGALNQLKRSYPISVEDTQALKRFLQILASAPHFGIGSEIRRALAGETPEQTLGLLLVSMNMGLEDRFLRQLFPSLESMDAQIFSSLPISPEMGLDTRESLEKIIDFRRALDPRSLDSFLLVLANKQPARLVGILSLLHPIQDSLPEGLIENLIKIFGDEEGWSKAFAAQFIQALNAAFNDHERTFKDLFMRLYAESRSRDMESTFSHISYLAGNGMLNDAELLLSQPAISRALLRNFLSMPGVEGLKAFVTRLQENGLSLSFIDSLLADGYRGLRDQLLEANRAGFIGFFSLFGGETSWWGQGFMDAIKPRVQTLLQESLSESPLQMQSLLSCLKSKVLQDSYFKCLLSWIPPHLDLENPSSQRYLECVFEYGLTPAMQDVVARNAEKQQKFEEKKKAGRNPEPPIFEPSGLRSILPCFEACLTSVGSFKFLEQLCQRQGFLREKADQEAIKFFLEKKVRQWRVENVDQACEILELLTKHGLDSQTFLKSQTIKSLIERSTIEEILSFLRRAGAPAVESGMLTEAINHFVRKASEAEGLQQMLSLYRTLREAGFSVQLDEVIQRILGLQTEENRGLKQKVQLLSNALHPPRPLAEADHPPQIQQVDAALPPSRQEEVLENAYDETQNSIRTAIATFLQTHAQTTSTKAILQTLGDSNGEGIEGKRRTLERVSAILQESDQRNATREKSFWFRLFVCFKWRRSHDTLDLYRSIRSFISLVHPSRPVSSNAMMFGKPQEGHPNSGAAEEKSN